MVDTVRTLTALQTLLADNATGAIDPQDLRDFLVSAYPLWTPYTPTWTSSGTAPAIGNGTLVGKYAQEGTGAGSLVVARLRWTRGTTTTDGTGTYFFGLPVSAVTTEGNGNGFGTLEDSGTGNCPVTSRLQDADSIVVIYGATPSASNAFGATSPIATLANGDTLAITVVYEAA